MLVEIKKDGYVYIDGKASSAVMIKEIIGDVLQGHIDNDIIIKWFSLDDDRNDQIVAVYGCHEYKIETGMAFFCSDFEKVETWKQSMLTIIDMIFQWWLKLPVDSAEVEFYITAVI